MALLIREDKNFSFKTCFLSQIMPWKSLVIYDVALGSIFPAIFSFPSLPLPSFLFLAHTRMNQLQSLPRNCRYRKGCFHIFLWLLLSHHFSQFVLNNMSAAQVNINITQRIALCPTRFLFTCPCEGEPGHWVLLDWEQSGGKRVKEEK